MRNSFDEQLKELNRELIEMGSLCEQIISGAIGALLKNSEEQRRLVDLCIKGIKEVQAIQRAVLGGK